MSRLQRGSVTVRQYLIFNGQITRRKNIANAPPLPIPPSTSPSLSLSLSLSLYRSLSVSLPRSFARAAREV